MGYNRDAACFYAVHFANKPCHDGATVGKSAIDPTQADFSFVDDPSPINENDCTHFVSCCIGGHKGTFTRVKDGKTKSFPTDKADVLPGGGISLEWDQPSLAYGMIGAPRFARHLVDKKKAVLAGGNLIPFPNGTAAQISKLEKANLFAKGDVIVYADALDLGSVGHCAIYMGNQLICCHTNNRESKPFDDSPLPRHYSYIGLLHLVG